MKAVALIIALLTFIIPTLASGEAPTLLWTRTYGLPDNDAEFWQAIEMPNGDLVMAGTTQEMNYNERAYIVRANPEGGQVWEVSGNNISAGQAICLAPDDAFLIAGYYDQNGRYHYIAKYDTAGNRLWYKIYNGWHQGSFRSIQPVGETGYILSGFVTLPDSTDDIILVRIDSGGDTLWSRTYGGIADERAWSTRPTSDNGFITAGWTDIAGEGNADIYVIKTDSNGNVVWSRTFGGEWNDEGRDIMETDDGGFVLCGKRTESNNEPDYYFMKVDSQGDSVWAYVYHGFNAVHRVLHSFTRTQDGGYALVGYNDIGFIDVFKTDSEGDSLWSVSFRNHPVVRTRSRSIVQSEDGGFYLFGYYQDFWMARLSPEMTGIDDEIKTLPDRMSLLINYPNPFNAQTTISFELAEARNVTLSVYDLLGRKTAVLIDGYLDAGPHTYNFDASDLTSGIYFYNLKSGAYSESKSMILLK